MRFNLRLVLVAFLFYGLGLATPHWIDRHKVTIELRRLRAARTATAESLSKMQNNYDGIFDGRGHRPENPRSDKLQIIVLERQLVEIDRQIEILANEQ